MVSIRSVLHCVEAEEHCIVFRDSRSFPFPVSFFAPDHSCSFSPSSVLALFSIEFDGLLSETLDFQSDELLDEQHLNINPATASGPAIYSESKPVKERKKRAHSRRQVC